MEVVTQFKTSAGCELGLISRIIYDARPLHNDQRTGRRLARAEDEVPLRLLGLVLCAECDSLALTQDEGADEADNRG